MSMLSNRKIVLGVGGGIAAYKSAELVRLLGKAGAEVHVVLSEGGARFVTPVTYQALSGNPVWSDLWDARMPNHMAHIDLGRDADAILVAPATADFLARLAHGHADDLLSTFCLARAAPLIVAPRLNRQMCLTGIRAARTGEALIKATTLSTIKHLQAFFKWLAMQEGYKSRINPLDIGYFNLTAKDVHIAQSRKLRPHPSLE